MEEKVIHISTGTILKILGIGLGIYLVFLVWDILLLLFVALIFAALIDPFARKLAKKKIPRGVAVLIIYIGLLGILGLAVSVLAPVIARDVPALLQSSEAFLGDVESSETIQQVLKLAEAQPANLLRENGTVSGVFEAVGGVFGGLFSFALVLVMTFYLVVQDDPVRKILRSVLPEQYVPTMLSITKKINEKLGAWVRGQLLLSLIMGVAVFIGLSILGVEYAAVIALLAALAEFVPYIGPILAAVPALFFGFTQGGLVLFAFVMVLYVVLQQAENHILVPKVMQHAVGLNPIISIIALLTGAELAGILGALIAIPVATALRVVIQEIMNQQKTL